jgi:hypothetical protein
MSGGVALGWYDVVGGIGVAAIVVTYLLLQTGRLEGRSRSFSALNALGAALVLVSLLYRFNLSAFLVELFWLLISIYGLLRRPGS